MVAHVLCIPITFSLENVNKLIKLEPSLGPENPSGLHIPGFGEGNSKGIGSADTFDGYFTQVGPSFYARVTVDTDDVSQPDKAFIN